MSCWTRRSSTSLPPCTTTRRSASRRSRRPSYKRHVLTDLDTALIPAVGVTPANVPEAAVAAQIQADLDAQQVTLGELSIDRAYLSSSLVTDRDPQLAV